MLWLQWCECVDGCSEGEYEIYIYYLDCICFVFIKVQIEILGIGSGYSAPFVCFPSAPPDKFKATT
jgi:hypothetical protein